MSVELNRSEFVNGRISPVRIIATNQEETNTAEGRWQDYIEVAVPCLLTVNANASANYSGTTANAGIRLFVRLEGELIASDMSFEGESNTVTFFSSASTTLYLEPGRYSLEVDREDIGTNTNFRLSVNYFAVFAKKFRVIE